MKRILSLCVAAGIMAVGVASKAEALPTLRLTACQGATCVSGPAIVGSTALSPIVGNPPVAVGDYMVSASGAALETPLLANAQETSISVLRTGSSSADPLVVYLEAIGYVLPAPPGGLNSTHGATWADVGPTTAADPVDFQVWLSLTNSGLVPGPPPTLPAGVITNGELVCVPAGPSPASCPTTNGTPIEILAGVVPYSLITRTTFNIGQTDLQDVYTSNSQAVVTAIPEPASMLLLGTGLMGLAGAVRRRRAAAQVS